MTKSRQSSGIASALIAKESGRTRWQSIVLRPVVSILAAGIAQLRCITLIKSTFGSTGGFHIDDTEIDD